MQKKGRNAKKKAETAFQFENSCQKRAKMEKKKAHLLGFFSLLYPLCIFCILNLKIHIKKTKCEKKAKKTFQIAKIHMQKKSRK